MALTLVQENALLALLDEPLVTLNELPKAEKVEDQDLFLSRQDTREKAVTGSVLKQYVSVPATLSSAGIVQLTNVINDDQTKAVTPQAVKNVISDVKYTVGEKLAKNANLSDLTDKLSAISHLGLNEMLYPVGAPIPWPSVHVPSGYLKCNGAGFDKALYPKLAQAYANGVLPDLRGEFIRGWDDARGVDVGRVILSYQGDAIRNITGTLTRVAIWDVVAESGALSKSGSGYPLVGGGGGVCQERTLSFNAANSVPTANENRPRNIAFLYIVRAA